MVETLERHLAACYPNARPEDPAFGRLLALLDAELGAIDAERSRLEDELARAEEGLARQRRRLDEDVAERQKLEVNLRQAEKLRAVGQLAAGIAHEINTPIQFVGDSVHFLREAFEDIVSVLSLYRAVSGAEDPAAVARAAGERAEEVDLQYLLEQIPKAFDRTLDGVQRVTDIVRAMKDFAHPERKERVLADVNAGLLSTLTVARNELKYVADVKVELGELPLISCLPNELNQVFLNLLVNAAHAIADRPPERRDRGQIGVGTSLVGDFVVVAISDNGCGIDDSIRDRIYDPFFTTKAVGRGSGQGLSIARSIVVEQHHGALSFKSEVGVGTTFYIRLPVLEPTSIGPAATVHPRLSGLMSITRP